MTNFNFSDKDLGSFKFKIDNSTFVPTHTSNLIIKSALKIIKNEDMSILDLGCGCGVVAIIISRLAKANLNLFASDISDSVEDVVNENSLTHSVSINVRKSDIFDAWDDHKFDLIINDISGVAQDIAKISPWFKNISCEAGKGGDLLVNKVISESAEYLNDNGKLIFPIISFSNKESILNKARSRFNNVELIMKQDWPVPNEMLESKILLEELKKDGYIDYKFSFGKLIGYTEVYCAY